MRMTEEMDDCFYRATQDDDVRVIVVKGAGEHFSSGHDLGTPEMNADRDAKGIPEQRNSPVMFDDRWEYDVETCQVPPPASRPGATPGQVPEVGGGSVRRPHTANHFKNALLSLRQPNPHACR